MRREQWSRFGWSCLSILLLSILSTGCNTELSRARVLLEKKDYLLAERLYRNVLRAEPDNEDALKEYTKLICETIKAKEKDEYNNTRCMIFSKKLYQRFPKDPNISKWYQGSLLRYSKALFISMQLKKASEYFEEYKKLDPNNGKVLFRLANCKFRLNQRPPRDDDALKQAVVDYKKAISKTRKGDSVAIFSSSSKNVLQWEAWMHIGRIHDLWITDKFMEFNSKFAGLRKKQDAAAAKCRALPAKRRSQRKKQKKCFDEVNKMLDGVKFKPNKDHFENLLNAYKEAKKIPTTNKYKRTLPYIQLALALAKYKRDYVKAIGWLKKADDLAGNTDLNVVVNMKMIYDRLAEKAESDGDKELKKKYEKLSVKYDSRVASLRGQK